MEVIIEDAADANEAAAIDAAAAMVVAAVSGLLLRGIKRLPIAEIFSPAPLLPR